MPEDHSILVDGEYLLEKYPGNGGWTFASIPEIKQNKNNPFGWVKVKGSIDGYPLKQFKLMPMGQGKLFLPVKAAIRKKINKYAGDLVHVILSLDESPTEITEEIKGCFDNEGKELFETFRNFTAGEQKTYLDWIYDAKTENTKAERIATMMSRLERKLKFYDKDTSK